MQKLAPPPDLYPRIISEIRYQEQLPALKRWRIFYGALLCASMVAFFLFVQSFMVQISSSGFIQFLSLLSSDFKIISGSFTDYALSLMASLPAISFGLVGLSLLLILTSLWKLLKVNFQLKHLKS